jgi:flagellum-specific peptidoglycan hydrolase FlgJ
MIFRRLFTLKPRTFILLSVCILPLLCFSQNTPSQNTTSQNPYITQYWPLAQTLQTQYGIPAEVIIGIGIYESNYGKSKVCRLLNNHHGLAGKNQLMKTHGVKSRYQQFESDSAGYVAFCNYVARRKYYERIKGSTDIDNWLSTIGRNGYCQNPTIWKKHILQLLKKHGLVSS